jgi:hypothetical protein
MGNTYLGVDMDSNEAVFTAWGIDKLILWGFCFSEEDSERAGYAFYTEEIISLSTTDQAELTVGRKLDDRPIGGYFNFELLEVW